MDLNDYHESISFTNLEEKHLYMIRSFFKNFKDTRVKNIDISIQTKNEEMHKLCNKYKIKYIFDIYLPIIQLNMDINYDISIFNINSETIEEDIILNEICKLNLEIEENLINFLDYEENIF